MVALVAVVVGLRLALRGWVGRVVDNHSICARCGFDLDGLDASARCPECGSESGRMCGNVRRSWGQIRRGVSLALIGTAVFAFFVLLGTSPGGMRSASPLWLARLEARWSQSREAIFEVARRVRLHNLSVADVRAIVAEALGSRHLNRVGTRAAWGDVVDAALATGMLNEELRQLCLDDAVAVSWNGTSERFRAMDDNGMLFVFEPAVGPQSWIGYDAEILSAEMDGRPLMIAEKKTKVYYRHVGNTAPGDTFVGVTLPKLCAGKTLIVQWKIRILDTTIDEPVGRDWTHTETIEVPSEGDGFFDGLRVRGDDE
ncbi:MAG TPA: hypothetical protein VG797_03550 [Phycisphaerales bacterium]|nr:hypothetical protein [Phycisphaerales bacterium]